MCSTFQVFLGDPHSCTCSTFLKDRDLCKHICWLILKKFRVPQNNPGIVSLSIFFSH
jgi:E3 ubiquitin-protein ligase ZSWIM2